MWPWFQKYNIQMRCSGYFHEHFQSYFLRVNGARPYWRYAKTGPGDGLVASHCSWWNGSCPAPKHYLNQCWLIDHFTPVNKHQWNLNQSTWVFSQEYARKMSSGNDDDFVEASYVIYTPLTKKNLATLESARGKHTQGTAPVTNNLNDPQALSHTKLLKGCKIKVPLYSGTLSCYNNLYRTHKLCYLNDSEISLWNWH